ncbi:Uncharacterised protein [Burkholderia pseudomallei]|nr:Uncharacterised protein [Burkholderia pseudomallei]
MPASRPKRVSAASSGPAGMSYARVAAAGSAAPDTPGAAHAENSAAAATRATTRRGANCGANCGMHGACNVCDACDVCDVCDVACRAHRGAAASRGRPAPSRAAG